MSLGSDRQQTLQVLKQVETQMSPIFTSVKLAQIRENKKFILECLNQSDTSNDLEEAEKTLLQFEDTKHTYLRTQQAEIVYPHNVYSIYCPIDDELELEDEYVRTFPILRKLKDEFNVAEKANFYANVAETFRKTRADKETWKFLLNKWIWDADLQKTVVYYQLLIRCGYTAVHLIKSQLSTNTQMSAINQHLEHMSKLIRNRSTLRKHIQFSVETKEQINEVSIVKTAKQLLCGVCLVYDCSKHKLDDDIIQESNQFVHPKNRPSQKMKLETANNLLNHYYSYCTESVMDEEREDRGACSATCYRYLKRQTFQESRHQISGLLSPSIKALIKLGVQMFAYSPCHIALVAQSKITCSIIFWYFIKYQNVQARIRFGFDTPINYLRSVTYAGKEELKQPRRKRKAKKKKEVSTGQSKNGPLNTVTPICYHHFLHKERSKEEDFNQTCDSCACAIRKFCLPSCLCDNKCKLRIKGCSGCKDCYSKQCPCFNNDRECDPEVCKCCYPNPDSYDRNSLGQLITCTNNQYQLQRYPKVKLGLSGLIGGGLGLFAGQFIPKNSIIISYSGQLIQNPVQQLRECISSDMYFYNFGFYDSSIDAKYFGNKSRFINHDNNKIQNAYSKVKFAKSDSFLAVYALDDIKKDEELYFDYDGNGILFKDFRDKYPFITERRNPPKQFT